MRNDVSDLESSTGRIYNILGFLILIFILLLLW
jgi:hypothetical protein